ncbi:AAA family ATPase [Acidiphilium multivorum]|uniref:AAA family ATPase n=1 Tax=Acidiphilium multivorum TaxID=62140 RepID=UPI001B8C048B|nr:AAA family ATPase [Acidiphilium multivorum]MBS3025665.1 AAA family ATPase [Acidiphilium multivorum]
MLVIVHRRDQIQHKYFEPLFEWASTVQRYSFVEDNINNLIPALPIQNNDQSINLNSSGFAPQTAITIFRHGSKELGPKYEAAIIADFAAIGYKCEKIDITPITFPGLPEPLPPPMFPMGQVPAVLTVKEVELPFPTQQQQMSAGMFRALCLLINLNYIFLSEKKPTIFIDDIGEGLDFERSKILIKLLIKKCAANGVQLIMSTYLLTPRLIGSGSGSENFS